MVMYFQDDFWQAISKLKTKEDQDAAIVALVRYHFERSEPSNPIADAILTVCKDRIELSQKRSKAGSTRKQSKSKTESNANQSRGIVSLSHSHSISKTTSNSESDVFDEVDQQETPFVWQCVNVFNDVMKRDVVGIPPMIVDCLNSRASLYTLEEVAGMIRMKRDEWQGTRMESNLKPTTLFSANHFDEYMDAYKHRNDEREFADDEIPY